jgi:transcriptional regulator GlxA family with amidase domain
MNLRSVSLKDFLPELKLVKQVQLQSVEFCPRVENSVSDKSRIQITNVEYTSASEFFINKAREVVEQNIADQNFNLDIFAVKMNLSKSTLQRRLKKTLKVMPGEYINIIRLKHARMMIINDSGSIRQIALAVGFKDSKYFARCFKKQFGMSPNELKMMRDDYSDRQQNDIE